MSARAEIIRTDGLGHGFLRLVRYSLRISTPDSERPMDVQRECVEGLRSAAVLPYDPRTGQIVLVEQLRVGALGSSAAGWLQEPPGGRIDGDRTPEETARREALEEAGCRIGGLTRIGLCRPAPGFADESVELFCGETDASCLPPYAGCRSEGEWTRVVVWDLEEAVRGLGREPLTAATLIVSVQWLLLNRTRLADLWHGPNGGGLPPRGPGRR